MKISRLIIASIAGTAAMTLFSEFLSRKEHKRFNEAKLLSTLHARIFDRDTPTKKDLVTGYLLHYISGIIFTYFFIVIYHQMSNRNIYKKEIAIGIAAGAVGITIWHLTLMLHHNPPRIYLKDYYFQLLLAHIILSVTAMEVYQKLE